MDEKRDALMKELSDLQLELKSDSSDIGDWKVVKSYEYSLIGEECPYDIKELHKKRQDARDRIDAIRAELNKIED